MERTHDGGAWIASDGGLLSKPIERRSLWLTPGQRAELLVDLSDGRPVALRTGPDPTFGMGMMEMMSGMGEPLDGPTTVLRLGPQAGLPGTTSRIPEHLVEREPLDYTRAVRRRQVRLTMGMGGMMGRGGMIGGGMGPGMMGGMMRRGMGSPGMIAMFGIDDRPYDTERIDQTIRLGDMEVWEVSGDMMTDPFHMYVHFEVLTRGGSRPSMGRAFSDLFSRDLKLLVVNGAGQQGLWEDMARRTGDIAKVKALRSKIVEFASNSAAARKTWTERPDIDAWIIWTIWQVSNTFLADLVEVEPEHRIYRDTGVALTRRGQVNAAAKEFIAFLQSPEGAAIFRKWGWIAGTP